ncbi:Hypothetical Protein FCC1311_007982 [Hondaea fermentalgiana]|uniref:Uncharacterized protein n=1 Tax=Hondaea fermentalgiana TaxID=2315210 RepID=A0A2R5G2N5_9STRA|nr:Hypothetical Protein FCC1311_007982 [Hondaea fermentalgiana]|eukprot:GBG24579.1 Hypothetical Protein FCC1311_007982 [Hondaea fermentalgiana]
MNDAASTESASPDGEERGDSGSSAEQPGVGDDATAPPAPGSAGDTSHLSSSSAASASSEGVIVVENLELLEKARKALKEKDWDTLTRIITSLQQDQIADLTKSSEWAQEWLVAFADINNANLPKPPTEIVECGAAHERTYADVEAMLRPVFEPPEDLEMWDVSLARGYSEPELHAVNALILLSHIHATDPFTGCWYPTCFRKHSGSHTGTKLHYEVAAEIYSIENFNFEKSGLKLKSIMPLTQTNDKGFYRCHHPFLCELGSEFAFELNKLRLDESAWLKIQSRGRWKVKAEEDGTGSHAFQFPHPLEQKLWIRDMLVYVLVDYVALQFISKDMINYSVAGMSKSISCCQKVDPVPARHDLFTGIHLVEEIPNWMRFVFPAFSSCYEVWCIAIERPMFREL